MTQQAIGSAAVIGLGKMGSAVARHLAGAGIHVAGFDIEPAAISRLKSSGVRAAVSAADAAKGCDLVIVLTAFEEQVADVLFGSDGVSEGAAKGTIVGVASTISPSAMRAFAERLEKSGLIPLDIPLCRGEPAAEAGKLLITGGGDKTAFERCRPAFATFANDIYHLGPAGSGQVGKMVNNLILWACLIGNHEGLALGEKFGIDPEAMRDMLLASSADNWALRERINFGGMPWPWAEKDMMIVLQEADHMRIALPLSGTLKEVVKGVKLSRGDFSGVLAKH